MDSGYGTQCKVSYHCSISPMTRDSDPKNTAYIYRYDTLTGYVSV